MSLIVTDSTGHKYRPTGHFREPKPGEFLYCFDHKRVEQRFGDADGVPDTFLGVNRWCSNGHVEFLLHRIIVEPVPEPKYTVTVPLTEADMARLHRGLGSDVSWLGAKTAALVYEGKHVEVTNG